jgi:hypothetical protein
MIKQLADFGLAPVACKDCSATDDLIGGKLKDDLLLVEHIEGQIDAAERSLP